MNLYLAAADEGERHRRGGWWGTSRVTFSCGGSGWERQGKAEEDG